MEKAVVQTFSRACRQRFGQAVGKLPLDLGLPCPNRRLGGCIYCLPLGYTAQSLAAGKSLGSQLLHGKRAVSSRFKKYYAYFQQETSTALPEKDLLGVLAKILADQACVGVILSTRPDFVETSLLKRLAKLLKIYDKDCLIELGLQSIHRQSLVYLNRNHSFRDFTEALDKIRQMGCFETGAHLIFGIPGESKEMMLTTLDRVCALGIDALKLHHLQVMKGTELARQYQKKAFAVFSLEGYLEFLLEALPWVPADVVIHRLWATSHPQFLVAPKWDILTADLSRELVRRMQARGLWQGIWHGR